MAHVAPTSHRRAARASHRGHRADDGPIQPTTWLGLTFAMFVGLFLSSRSHIGVHAAGITLLLMLVPLTLAVYVAAFRRGVGSTKGALITGAVLSLVVLKLIV